MKKLLPFIFYLTLFLIILCFSMSAGNYDFDLWARLIAGMGVIDGHEVLKTDFLSYTPTHIWWDHEWGSGVIFYFFLKHFGAYSLVILQSILIFGIFFTASRILKLKGVKNPNNFVFYFFSLMAIMGTLNHPIRCHLFSFLFFTIFIYILEKARKDSQKLLYILPFLTILWNNIHGGVVSGVGLILLFAIGEFLNHKPIKDFLITFILSAISLIINPWGFDYIKFLLMANTMERTHIMEWWSPFCKYHLYKHLIFKAFLIFIVSVEFLTVLKNKASLRDFYRNQDKVKWILFFTTTYLAFSHVKLIPFFIIFGLIYCYEDFYSLVSKINLPQWKDKVIYAIVITGALFSLSIKEFTPPVDFSNYPIREVEFIKINQLKGKLLVNFGLGSYVSYKLYPQNVIFMDGRYEEVYYDFMMPMLKRFFLLEEGWNDVLIKYTPDIMILENYYPIYNHLANSKDWVLVYNGNIFGVFVKTKDKKNNYINPTEDLSYYKDTLFETEINLRKNE